MSPGLCPGSLGGLALPPQADGHACGSHSPPTGGPPSTRVPVFSLAVVLLRYPGGAGTEGAAARDRSVRWLSCPGFADGGSFCDRRPHGHPPSPGAGPGFLWASWCGELRFGAAKGWGGGNCVLVRVLAAPGAAVCPDSACCPGGLSLVAEPPEAVDGRPQLLWEAVSGDSAAQVCGARASQAAARATGCDTGRGQHGLCGPQGPTLPGGSGAP